MIVQRGMHGVPWQSCAFHPDRKLAHSRKHFEIPKDIVVIVITDVELTSDHAVKSFEERLRLFLALPFQGLRHHAGSGFGDRATRAFEAYFLYAVFFQVEVNRQMIAAKWIKPFGRMVRRLQLAKVSGLLVVVENDLLIELA